MVWKPLRLVYKPILAYTYFWVSHGAAPPSTCTQVEEKAVSLALLNTSWTIKDHTIRITLFFIPKDRRYLQVCASTASCGAHAGSGRRGKGGMTAMANNSSHSGSGSRPDLTCLYWV